jgi:hypothetical protein
MNYSMELMYRAYTTLINKNSRDDYDEYMESHMSLSGLWRQYTGENEKDE